MNISELKSEINKKDGVKINNLPLESGIILGVGAPIVDFLSQIPEDFLIQHYLEKGGAVNLTTEELDQLIAALPNSVSRVIGGSAGNTVCGLAQLGMPIAIFGALGDDNDGNFYLDELEKLGGNSRRIKLCPGAPTARCLSMITPDAERTMRSAWGASLLIFPEEITPALFDGVSLMHVEGYFLFNPACSTKLFQTAKAAGVKISLDMGTFELVRRQREYLEFVLKNYVDVIFANADEANEYCGVMPPEQQAGILAAPGVICAIKLGEKGCCVGHDGQFQYIPAKMVSAKDTTGAGDLWQCGFLYGYLNGYPLADAAELGAKIAAEVVQVVGAQIPDKRWKYICENLK
ncbi:MAG: adenosine kinase [Lentisphaeria bacterium]|nr:adenosine kinase [Lentisphaeria bacterium]